MKHNVLVTSIALGTIGLIGCTQPKTTSEGEGTKLSEISVNFPAKDKLPGLFGGVGCPAVKLKPEELARLGTADVCEAVGKLIDGFKLTIAQNQCDAGVTGTNKTLTGKNSQNKLSEKVVKGCKYDVLLEVGEIEAGKIYFSNAHAAKSNLDVPKTAPTSLQLKIELMVTESGVGLGFPKTDKIITDTQSDLSIDATFGRSSPSPTLTPSATPTSPVPSSPSPSPSVSPRSPGLDPNVGASVNPSSVPDISTAPNPPGG